jgi:hypothetical protein
MNPFKNFQILARIFTATLIIVVIVVVFCFRKIPNKTEYLIHGAFFFLTVLSADTKRKHTVTPLIFAVVLFFLVRKIITKI